MVSKRCSVRLAAEEGRNIELVVLGRVMHSRLTAVRIEALRSSPAGIFRHGIALTAFRLARGRTLGLFELRHGPRGARHRRRLRLLGAAAEADRSEALQGSKERGRSRDERGGKRDERAGASRGRSERATDDPDAAKGSALVRPSAPRVPTPRCRLPKAYRERDFTEPEFARHETSDTDD